MAEVNAKRDEEREDRIAMEIVVDAYGPEERALSWYYYLQSQLRFPFKAACFAKRAISPLKVKDKVEVVGIPVESECEREIFVTILRDGDELAVPLSQLRPTAAADDDTRQAVGDWHYWVAMGYEY